MTIEDQLRKRLDQQRFNELAGARKDLNSMKLYELLRTYRAEDMRRTSEQHDELRDLAKDWLESENHTHVFIKDDVKLYVDTEGTFSIVHFNTGTEIVVLGTVRGTTRAEIEPQLGPMYEEAKRL